MGVLEFFKDTNAPWEVKWHWQFSLNHCWQVNTLIWCCPLCWKRNNWPGGSLLWNSSKISVEINLKQYFHWWTWHKKKQYVNEIYRWKLGGMINPEWNIIQEELDDTEVWNNRNGMKFNSAKIKAMHLETNKKNFMLKLQSKRKIWVYSSIIHWLWDCVMWFWRKQMQSYAV